MSVLGVYGVGQAASLIYYGLHTMHYEELLGKKISRDAKLGTPMSWELVDFT